MTLRLRAALAAGATVAVVVLVAHLAVGSLYEGSQSRSLDDELARQAGTISALASELDVPPDELTALIVPSDRSVRWYRDGELIGSLSPLREEDHPPLASGYSTVSTSEGSWRFFTSPPGPDGIVAQVGRSRQNLVQSIDAVERITATVGISATLAALVLGLLSGRAVLAPLARLRDTAGEVAATTHLGMRLDEGGPGEVRELAVCLNTMLDRLAVSARGTQAALASAESFGAAVAHELRTPLTSMRTNLEFLLASTGRQVPEADRQAAAAEVLVEQDRMVRLLDGLRLLARSQSPDALVSDLVDLGELVDERIVVARGRWPGSTLVLTAPAQPVWFLGWREGLASIVDNLVDNAVKHGSGRDPKWVQVTLEVEEQEIRLVVDDRGPGVAVSERSLVFERFRQGTGAAPSGIGLGLTLVAQLTEVHRGRVWVEDAPGGGARFVVVLPDGHAGEPAWSQPAPS